MSLASPCSLQAVAGLLADARSLAEVAREEASNFRSNYGHDIPLKVILWTWSVENGVLLWNWRPLLSLQHLSDRVAMYVHAYTLYSAVRPFGCRLVVHGGGGGGCCGCGCGGVCLSVAMTTFPPSSQLHSGLLRQRRRSTTLHGWPIWNLICESVCSQVTHTCEQVINQLCVFRATGDAPLEKQNRPPRRRSRSCRWVTVDGSLSSSSSSPSLVLTSDSLHAWSWFLLSGPSWSQVAPGPASSW